MSKKLFNRPLILSLVSGSAVFLAFPPFNLWPMVLVFAVSGIHLSRFFTSIRSAFGWGFLVSCVIMCGGFYWIIYVIHEFGYLPWSVAAVLFIGFCGLGALNFPLTAALSLYIERRFQINSKDPSRGAWGVIGIPALFTIVEFSVPKLFPWGLGHCLYKTTYLNQIAELTGTTFLSFILMSWGGAMAVCFLPPAGEGKVSRRWLWVPGALTLAAICFSVWRVHLARPLGKLMRVAIVQANIGNVEKVAARHGFGGKLRVINDRYESLTEQALNDRPDLIVWPETALAYRLDGLRDLSREIDALVKSWNRPLVTGAYAPGEERTEGDANAAYLLEPDSSGQIVRQFYSKNVLLAFGEYMPFGGWFPILYRWFPQVSHFERGTTQKVLVMRNGTRLGISICYEMILPRFMQKVASHLPHVFVNLTNDSWFGPTAEPYLHGAISVFRSIEHRIPSIRATNTGSSFVVDALGRMGDQTKLFEPTVLIANVTLPDSPQPTLYGRWGDWFIAVCSLLLIGIIYRSKRSTSH